MQSTTLEKHASIIIIIVIELLYSAYNCKLIAKEARGGLLTYYDPLNVIKKRTFFF